MSFDRSDVGFGAIQVVLSFRPAGELAGAEFWGALGIATPQIATLRLSWHDLGCGRRGPVKLFPGMFGVAPAPAELQIDAHRHFERDGVAAELRDQFGLLARASPSSREQSCICSSGTMPSRQQARIHSLV